MTLAERFVSDIEELSDLPSHSPILAQLLATLGRDDASLTDVAATIREDPGLTARVLRAANSAAYAGRSPVNSLREALLRLGFVMVRRLAVVVSLYTAVPTRGSRSAHETYWRHSLGVAHAAETIARHATLCPEGTDAEMVFLGGLLHDIGLLVLESHYPKEYAAVAEVARADNVPFAEAEVTVLQTDHGELGAVLAAHWALPEAISTMIRAHHRLHLAPPEYHWGARVVHLADFACDSEGLGDFREGTSNGFDTEACAELGLAPDTVPALLEETRAAVARALSLLQAATG